MGAHAAISKLDGITFAGRYLQVKISVPTRPGNIKRHNATQAAMRIERNKKRRL